MSLPIMDLKDRLKKAMQLRNYKPVEVSEKTGIPKSAISQYMSGYAKPKQDRIYLLSKALNVNETWLLGYDVPMNPVNEKLENIEKNLSHKEQLLLTKYRTLDDKGKHTVDTVLQMEYNRCNPSAEEKEEIRLAAAHNDNTSPEQLKLMKKDLDEL